ncbi:ferric reductase-like transmembrane domain-containing protein [Bacillus timonensis]|uniref:ferric reductase-like transmembrane domain-containing protein n=1 Tax=Bacillus timonensis TaxID=1033734 RepID=UPI00028A359E|nr:ferric reductase-like transmembrane domain-containing protein [Bacillus timonensis]
MSFDWLSTWSLIRISGFLAYFLFSLSIAAGLMNRLYLFKKQRPLLLELHKLSGWIGMLTVVFHATLLLVDSYMPYPVFEILIPFTAENDPVISGLGTISFYLFLLTIGTSDFFMKQLGRSLWKKIHFLVIPAWCLMVLHGILMGTDSTKPWAAFIYGGGTILVIILLVFRYVENLLESTGNKKGKVLKKTP